MPEREEGVGEMPLLYQLRYHLGNGNWYTKNDRGRERNKISAINFLEPLLWII